jgi:AraC-like DNA-binding protein
VSPVELEHLQGEGQAMDMRFDVNALGPLSIQSLRFSAAAARRTPRLARDDSPPSLFVIAKRTGSSVVVQDGRETVVGAGSLFLLNSTKPSLVLSNRHTQQDVVQIPVQHLALPEPALRQALALRLGPELPLAGVLGRFIDSLTTVADVQPTEAQHLARATVDLVRGLVTTLQGDPRPARDARDALDATLGLRVTDYLHAHWREHDLTADRIASAHHISTRQLYRLLAAQGISLGDWLREQRLEASRDELARAGAAAGTIAGVGRRWGFPDATNFGRAFKARYGLTPLEWRQLHQAARR